MNPFTSKSAAAVLESITDAFYALDPQWRLTYVNRKAEAHFGIASDDVLGRVVWDLFPTARGSVFQERFEEAFATGEPVEFEARSTVTGRWLSVRVTPTDDGLGVFFHDITARKEAEEAGRLADEQFRQVADALPVLIAYVDAEQRYRFNNRTYERWFGVSRDDLRGRHLRDVLGEAAYEQVRPNIEAVLAGEELRADAVLNYAGAGRRAVEVLYTPHRDPAGRVVGYFTLIQDVTARREAAERVQEAEQRFRLLANAAPALIWIADTTRACTWFNRGWLEYTGRTLEQEVGDGWTQGVHPDDFDHCVRTYTEAFDARRPFAMDYRLRRADGEYGWLLDQAVPNFAPGGEFLGYIGACVDITDRKRSQLRDAFLVRLDDEVRPLAEPQEITQTAARLLGEYLGVDRCAYADVEADEDTMNLAGNYTRGPEVRSIVGRLRFADFGDEVRRLMREDRVFVAHDVETHTPPVGDLAAYRAAQIRAVICAPLRKRGRLAGAMAVHSATPRVWRPDEVELVRAVAARCWESIERARVTEALRESREQLKTVVSGANVGVWYHPLPFGRLTWDDKVREHFHLPPGAPVTIDTFYERIHPDDRDRVRQTIDASLRDRQPFDIHYRTRSPDGTRVKWVRASGGGFYNSDGEPVRFDGITIDATAQVLAEQRAREESAVVDTIHRVGQAVAAELDLRKLVQIVTDATTRLTGAQFGAFFMTDERSGSDSLYSVSGVDRSYFDRFPMPRKTGIFGPTFRGEGVIRLDDVLADPRYGRNASHGGTPESHLPVRSYLAVPVTSRSGDQLGALFFGHEEPGVFTERAERLAVGIAAQAAVGIDNARLFEAARCANAQKDQLLASERAARGEAEQASRMKDEFLATLSHELRTPLNAIYGWSQILLQASGDPLPDNVRQGLETIERNARAQTQIIEDLLDMSRIISGKIRLDVQRVALAPVIEAAVETVRHAADAKGVRLQVVLDPKAGPVSGDPQRLQQVLWNLINNAIKFTPRGGRVQVLLERVNSHLEVLVVDTGQGIAPEFLPHVFDRFRQADGATTRRHGGLGLGLAIAKHLIELHGGTIRVKSPGVDRGTTFTIALPLAVLQADSDGSSRRHPEAEPSPRSMPEVLADLDRVRVLVVDDEPDARELVRRLLEERGARVVTAGSASEAMDHLRAQPPDVLITDVGMPGEDGYALLKQVRSLKAEEGGRVPAIALTAYARSQDRVRSVLAGFQMHIAKPVEPAELLATVAHLAGRNAR